MGSAHRPRDSLVRAMQLGIREEARRRVFQSLYPQRPGLRKDPGFFFFYSRNCAWADVAQALRNLLWKAERSQVRGSVADRPAGVRHPESSVGAAHAAPAGSSGYESSKVAPQGAG